MTVDSEAFLTIEELSFQCGVTTRNIRAYQSRGLLPSPVTRTGERTGFYGHDHIARLNLINRLQARGYSLAGIAELLQAWAEGRSLEQLVGMESVVAAAQEDDSRLMSEAQLLQLAPPGVDLLEVMRQLRGLGLAVREGKQYRLRQPKLLELGLQAAAAGIPIAQMLREFERMQKDAHRIARRFVRLFDRHVMQPYLDAGMPASATEKMIASMTALRKQAAAGIKPLMAVALSDEIEAAVARRLPIADRPQKDSKA